MIWIALGLVGFLAFFFPIDTGATRVSLLLLGWTCFLLFHRVRRLERLICKEPSSAADIREPTDSPYPAEAPTDPVPSTVPVSVPPAQTPAAPPINVWIDDFLNKDDREPDMESTADLPPVPEPVLSTETPTPPPSLPPDQPLLWVDKALSAAWTWLKSGNPMVKVGLVILLLGVSFLLKYAAANALFPPELRAAGAGLLGITLLFVGWKLRETRKAFALLIQGGGIATLYLTIFSVTRFLGLLSPVWALVFMTAIVVFSVILAIFQNAAGLAVFGWAGGFMAPILLSTGTGSHVHLFSYYALLNAGLLGVSMFRNWRILNLLGFFCTFGIGSIWGLRYYRPGFFATTEPFLILFFLMYAAISIFFARSGENKKETRLDSTLVLGLPLVVFGLQMGLVRDMEMGGAYSCLALSAWYLGTVKFLWKGEKRLHLLAETHIGLGIVFLSLAIPMALDATATASTWALEGAGMVFLGLRQNRLTSRIFGILLQIAAAFSFLIASRQGMDIGPLLAGLFLGIGGFVSSWAYCMFKKDRRPWESFLDSICGLWGGLFGYSAWWAWCVDQRFGQAPPLFLMGVIGFHLIWVIFLSRNTIWEIPAHGARLFIGFLFFITLIWSGGHPAAHYGWILWPVAMGIHFATLHAFEKKWSPSIVSGIHTSTLLLIVFLAMWETRWLTFHWLGPSSWPHTFPALMAGCLMMLISKPPVFLSWPLRTHPTACMRSGAIIAAFLVLWWIVSCTMAGNPAPLAYVPVLNILDLGQALVLIFLSVWCLWAKKIRFFANPQFSPIFIRGMVAAVFVWISVVMTRMAHFGWGVDYTRHGIFQSAGLQAAYSVIWSLMAVSAMVYSHRRLHRKIWMTGAGLLGLVVIKLFFVDLSGHGTVARIVSFLGVGILMLLVGYGCPLPPKEEKK